jgi:hypothetical protein
VEEKNMKLTEKFEDLKKKQALEKSLYQNKIN